MKNYFIAIISTIILASITGCVFIDRDPLFYQGEDPKHIYLEGHKQINNKDYHSAIKKFRFLNIQYPFHKYTELGNLDLVYAYHQDNNPGMLINLSQRFLRLYPSSKYLGYIYYMMGITNFNNGRSFFQKHLPYDMSQHNPEVYIEAYNQLKKSVLINPKANYVDDAIRRMLYINNVSATYQYNIAKFYFDHKAYTAAINRAEVIIRNYPQTNVIQDALVLCIKSYNTLTLSDQENRYIEILRKNYPHNAYLRSIQFPIKAI
jgi:outer membrane protein assembly factor BamD